MIVIGLTGNLGVGKTTVAAMFKTCGAAVINADDVAHELLEECSACRQAIVRAFGDGVMEKGRVSRRKLADHVFGRPDRLRRLEAIIHPRVKRRVREMIAELRKRGRVRMVILDVPLLFEVGMERTVDVVVTVRANQRLQIERVVDSRHWRRADIIRRLRRQMSQREKMERADFVIDNRFSRAKTRAQVAAICRALVTI